MRQIAVKGDEYLIWEDTYKDPSKQIPPPPDPLDPEDPEKYTEAPFYDPLYKVDETDTPDTGDEFVFCQGKPVCYVGYVFSTVKKETYRRQWSIDEEGHLVTDQEEEYKKAKKAEEEKAEKDPSYEPKDIKKGGTPVYKDQKKDMVSAGIVAVDGIDYVYIDGVPMSCMNGGVSGTAQSSAVIDGKVVPTSSEEVEGEFTKCYGHVYFDD